MLPRLHMRLSSAYSRRMHSPEHAQSRQLAVARYMPKVMACNAMQPLLLPVMRMIMMDIPQLIRSSHACRPGKLGNHNRSLIGYQQSVDNWQS